MTICSHAAASGCWSCLHVKLPEEGLAHDKSSMQLRHAARLPRCACKVCLGSALVSAELWGSWAASQLECHPPMSCYGAEAERVDKHCAGADVKVPALPQEEVMRDVNANASARCRSQQLRSADLHV